MLRLRLPGGRIVPEHLEILASLATHGPLVLHEHSVIALPEDDASDAATATLVAAGLGAHVHPRARAIVSSPLSTAWAVLAAELAAAVAERAGIGTLPPSLLFALDDHGDVAAFDADIEIRSGVVHLGAQPTTVPAEVERLVDAAEIFARLRGDHEHVRDLPDGAHRIATELGAAVTGTRSVPVPTAPPIGWFDRPDGSVILGAAVVEGELDARLAAFLAAIGVPLVVTPWGTLVIAGLAEGAAETVVRVLAPMGLVFDADSVHVTGAHLRPGDGTN